MRLHLLNYTKENYVELETALKKQLEVCRQSLQSYLELMERTPTSGSEITLLILCHMFRISILVVRSDFIWVSENIAPLSADVVIVQNCNGHFLGMKRIDSKLVDIGEVPQYTVNKCKSPCVKTLTPKERGNITDGAEIIDPGVSPILEKEEESSKEDTAFSLTETTSSTRMLRNEVRKFEEGSMEDKDESNVENMEDKKKFENVTKLNIRDIGNDHSSDITRNMEKDEQNIIMMPNSTQPLNITTEGNNTCTSDKVVSLVENQSETNIRLNSGIINDKSTTKGQSDDSKTVTPTKDDMMSLNETRVSIPSDTNVDKEKEEKYDSDETVDCLSDDKKSEISDHYFSGSEDIQVSGRKESEISDNKPKKSIKHLGLNGPVVVLKPLPKHEVYIEAKKKNEEDVKYKSISAVKLGCNRCTDVFYSEGGYNDHLFKKHRVRNVLRNPLTVINKLWSRIQERQPLFEGQEECEICGARYFDKLFY